MDGIRNTANGVYALNHNISGGGNTAVGYQALVNNTANSDTAVGNDALVSNTSGSDNTAIGAGALAGNMISHGNTAIGSGALASGVGFSGTDGNTAIGYQALFSSTVGFFNVAIGYHALFNQTIAADNIALGANAGSNVVTADNVICIGTAVSGANVGNTCFIGNIFGVTTGGAGSPVLVDSSGQLGTMSSSRRFKNEIKPMDSASESILALKPVTFHYKSDPAGAGPQFGLIAEEVAEVNPDLVVRDKNGEIYTVRYDAVNAMLLNEFLKEHRKVQKLQATVVDQQKSFQSKLAEQEKRIEALASGLQKVSARLSASSRSRGEPHVGEPAQQVVARTPRENSDLASATSFCNPH
jgi:hypothetical protein